MLSDVDSVHAAGQQWGETSLASHIVEGSAGTTVPACGQTSPHVSAVSARSMNSIGSNAESAAATMVAKAIATISKLQRSQRGA
jgi:ABC-type Fe3+ transport system permease subunit